VGDAKEKRKIPAAQKDHQPSPVIGDDFSLDKKHAAGKKRCQNRNGDQK